MNLSGKHRIEAPRDKVWAALNDPDVLKQAIPGCEKIEKISATELTATVKTKVGPVSARFSGVVRLSDLDPPRGYTISGEGKGGAAGFAKGGAKIRLEEDGTATILHYEVDAQVGGKLAQIGSRLIDGTARKLSGQFFDNFAAAVAGPQPTPAEEKPPVPVAAGASLPQSIWVVGVIIVVLALLAIFALR
ncbi:MAG: CoxG family protein [Alphaproteobacteria bacterium]